MDRLNHNLASLGGGRCGRTLPTAAPSPIAYEIAVAKRHAHYVESYDTGQVAEALLPLRAFSALAQDQDPDPADPDPESPAMVRLGQAASGRPLIRGNDGRS